MTIRRTGAFLAAVTLGVSGLAACSGGGDQAYCDSIESAQSSMQGAFSDATDPEALGKGLEKAKSAVNDMADKAPDEIKAEWDTVATTLNDLDMDKLTEMMKDPAKADPAAAQELMDQFTKAGESMSTAGEKIESDAKERCGDTSGS